MKQNHKKIKIYSESLCASANTFENFQSIKGSLQDLIVLSKQDLTINTFLKSKLIDSSQKMDIFRKAFNEVFNKELLDILLVMIENDDMNLLVEVNRGFVALAKKKLNIAYVEVTSPFTMNIQDQDSLVKELSDITHKKININFSVNKELIGGLKIKMDDMLFDSSLKIDINSDILKTASSYKTWIITSENHDLSVINKFEEYGVEIISVALDGEGHIDLYLALAALAKRGITRLMVEGGATLSTSFLRSNLVDLLAWFRAPSLIGADGKSVFSNLGVDGIDSMHKFELLNHENIGSETLDLYGRIGLIN